MEHSARRSLDSINTKRNFTLADPGIVSVAILHGLNHDPQSPRTPESGVTLHTLWGELAYQIGGKPVYERIRAQDEGTGRGRAEGNSGGRSGRARAVAAYLMTAPVPAIW